MKILILVIGDLLLLYGALWASLTLRYWPDGTDLLLRQHLLPFSFVFFVWILLFGSFRLYDFRFTKNNKSFTYRLLQAMATNTIIAVLLFYLLPILDIEPRRNLLLIVVTSTAFLLAWRHIFNALIVRAPQVHVLFFSANPVSPETTELADYLLKNPQLGNRPVAFVSEASAPESVFNLPHYPFDERQFADIVRERGIDAVVIAPEMKRDKSLVKALFQSIPLGITIFEFPAFYETVTGKVPLSLIAEVWFLENLIGVKPRYDFFKRLIDIILASIFGVLFFLLLPFIAIAIVFSRPSDVWEHRERRARPGDGLIFFRQLRVGKNGRLFNFVKLRSQVLGAEEISREMREAKETHNDPRRYPVGTLLRRSYLDELGQIWNVIRGEMSFVGPRPERPEYVETLKQKVPFYEMRLLVKPGITGWAQVNMENDAAVEDAPEKMQYDLYYIKHRSVWLDSLILLRTVFAILGRQGR